MNKLLLSFIRHLAPFWRGLGVDPNHLQTILEIKLKMDARRRSPFSYGRSAKSSNGDLKAQDLLTMFFYLLTGGMFVLFNTYMDHQASAVTLFFSGWMILLALTLISDFTDVLIDVRDNYILLPRPVSNRTIVIGRILHIVFYLTKLVVPFFIPGIIYFFVRFGLGGGFLFLLMAFISTVLALFLVNLVYLVLIQFTSPWRFREVIGYIQIFFTASVLVGYNLFSRIITLFDLEKINLLDRLAWRLLPPAWLGALWEWWIEGAQNPYLIFMGLLALVAPFLAVWLSSRLLTQNFNQKLLAIGEGGGGESERKLKKRQAGGAGWMFRTAGWWRMAPQERAVYELAWRLTQRSRDFKLKFYPSFVFFPVYFVLLFTTGSSAYWMERLTHLQENPISLVLLYFMLLMLSTALQTVTFSDHFKSAWVFIASPVQQPGLLLSGLFKMAVTRFYYPLFAVVLAFYLAAGGLSMLDDCLLAFFANQVIVLAAALVSPRHLPFSRPWSDQTKGTGVSAAFFSMFLAGIIGFGHYLLRERPAVIWAAAAATAWLFFFLLNRYRQATWPQIAETGQ